MNYEKDSEKMEEGWWVDFIEGDIDADTRENLSILLSRSETDQQVVENLRSLRAAIKTSDSVVMPEGEGYYRNLQQKIMMQIRKTDSVKSAESKETEQGKRFYLKDQTLSKN